MRMAAYITLEGIDCTGKTTLSRSLKLSLSGLGLAVSITNEFPTEVYAQRVIEASLAQSIFISEGFEHGPRAAFFFMLYAQSLSFDEIGHGLVIGDRGIDSLCVYQGTRAAHPSSFQPTTCLAALESLYRSLSLPLPDLTILLTLSEVELVRRFAARNERDATPAELAELMQIQDCYMKIAGQSNRFAIINADSPATVVEKTAIQVIRNRILNA